ncbi:hypothetical protein BTJ48_04503 [Bacillus mycoides]|nr:hypothetical protein [Bacillus mycoides]OSY04643.1 hypothetical protein BTJ48_04503 [Bacillus mycoides]
MVYVTIEPNSVGYPIGFLVPGITSGKYGFTTLRKLQHRKIDSFTLGTDF